MKPSRGGMRCRGFKKLFGAGRSRLPDAYPAAGFRWNAAL